MELKFELKSIGSISADSELKNILLWNQHNKSNMVYYVSGEIDDFEGKIEIVSEQYSIEYTYKMSINPSVTPIYSFIVNGNSITINNEIDELCAEYDSLCIALMYFLKRKLKFTEPKNIHMKWDEDAVLKLVDFVQRGHILHRGIPSKQVLNEFKTYYLCTQK